MKTQTLAATLLIILASFNYRCSRDGAALNAQSNRDLCNCGPDTCLNDPRYLPKLSQKKADMKKVGFPDDLIALLDRDGKCVMAIDQAPDAFRILLVKNNGTDTESIAWSKQDEEIAKNEVLKGQIKSYFKFNVRKVFACCAEPKGEDRPDWDKTLSLSRSLAISCSNQGGKVVCQ